MVRAMRRVSARAPNVERLRLDFQGTAGGRLVEQFGVPASQ
jgi:hypothetical protein